MGLSWVVVVVLGSLHLVSLDCAPIDNSTECLENFRCIPIALCRSVADFAYPCNNDSRAHMMCCPVTEQLLDRTSKEEAVEKPSSFPENCGAVSTGNRITGGVTAVAGEYPWMALLGYLQNGISLHQFLCGGTIITENYILSAAHCINFDSSLTLDLVRLGELDLKTEVDCETIGNEEICADPYVEIPVERHIAHKSFNSKSLENDIALVKLKNRINFTDYVQPICLPFSTDVNAEVVDRKFRISGWGKTDSANLGGSTTLQYAIVTGWDPAKCNAAVPPEARPIKQSQICANGRKKEDSCKGDSGGPLMNTTQIKEELRTFQIGIVSFASARVCGNSELPTMYTRVDYYLRWIVDNIE